MFLVYGGDKELIVKGYVDASFDSDDGKMASVKIRVHVIDTE